MHITFAQAKSVMPRVYFSGIGDDENFFRPEDWLFFDESLQLESYCSFMGNNSLCSMGSFSYSWSRLPTWLKLGRFCSIAGGLKFMGERHPYERITSSSFTYDSNFIISRKFIEDNHLPFLETEPTQTAKNNAEFGHDVWIGEGVTLGNGIKIGHGAIIAANSHVVKDVPPYAIVGGNPAKIIKMRFSDDVIERLLRVQWWNYVFTSFEHKSFLEPNRALDVLEDKIAQGTAQIYYPWTISAQDLINAGASY